MPIPLKEQAAFAEEYLRYLYKTNNEADSLRKIVEKELFLLIGKKHPLFSGGPPSVVVKVELGNPSLSKG
jgi:hypothetical protein